MVHPLRVKMHVRDCALEARVLPGEVTRVQYMGKFYGWAHKGGAFNSVTDNMARRIAALIAKPKTEKTTMASRRNVVQLARDIRLGNDIR